VSVVVWPHQAAAGAQRCSQCRRLGGRRHPDRDRWRRRW